MRLTFAAMTTSAETLATLRRSAENWLTGNLEGVLGAYADDAVFHYFGDTDVAGTHTGKAAAVEAMAAVSARAARRIVEIVDVLAGDRLGAIIAIEELTRDDEVATIRRT